MSKRKGRRNRLAALVRLLGVMTTASACFSCLRDIDARCLLHSATSMNGTVHIPISAAIQSKQNDEVGRVLYTVAILLMFALIILILMFRSIKRNSATVEMEALLDAMRFREELDLQQRQRRRLLKAKSKVSAWLTKTNPTESRLWKSSPQLLQPRKHTLSSIASDVPEIVVTVETSQLPRAHTPALSLIYNFEGVSGRPSLASSLSGSIDIDPPLPLPHPQPHRRPPSPTHSYSIE